MNLSAENGHSLKTWPSDDSKPPAKEPEVKASEEFQDFADAEKEFEDDEDDDFDVKLDQPEPQDDVSLLVSIYEVNLPCKSLNKCLLQVSTFDESK